MDGSKTAEKIISGLSIPIITAPYSTKIERTIYNMDVTYLLNSELGTTGQSPTTEKNAKIPGDTGEDQSLGFQVPEKGLKGRGKKTGMFWFEHEVIVFFGPQ